MEPIDLYFAPTANGRRAAIVLEEAELAYRVHRVRFDAKPPALLELNAAGTIPVIVDPAGPGARRVVLAQSAAIMMYVAEKTGRFWPADELRRLLALQWFAHAVSDVAGASAAWFAVQNDAPVKSPETAAFLEQRLFAALRAADRQLAGRPYLAEELTLADLALYPFAKSRWSIVQRHGGLDHLGTWLERMGERPAIARAMALE